MDETRTVDERAEVGAASASHSFGVFISSPGGMDQDRSTVTEELARLSSIAANRGEPGLRPIRWPQEFASGVADYGQQVINRQADGYDILLCLVGVRLGTPTPRANSGTEEELDVAIDAVLRGRPVQVLAFFSDTPTHPSAIDPFQLMLVRAFQAKIARLGVLYQSYRTQDELRQLVRISLSEAHRRLIAHEDPMFQPQDPRHPSPAEEVRFEDRVFLPQTTAPQWASALAIPVVAHRGRTIRLEGTFRSLSPYFRFGFKYADVREPLFSSGSVQTPGQNILTHLGRNMAGAPLFVTAYRAGFRLDEDRLLPETETCEEAPFRVEINRTGEVHWEFNSVSIYRAYFPIDGHPQLSLLAWGDEHDYQCEVSNLRLYVMED